MLLLKLECSNFFLFENLSLDFTYPRKLNSEIAKNDEIFPGSKIKVRKHIVIMGANASGKTTLGELLCLIYNFLIVRDVGPMNNLGQSINDTSRPASFTIEFSIQKTAYRLSATFDKDGLIKETLTQSDILKKYNISELRHHLDTDNSQKYDRNENTEFSPGFYSYLLRLRINEDLVSCFRAGLQFWFILSAFQNNTIGQSGFPILDVSLVAKLLPVLDNSIQSVNPLYPKISSAPTSSASTTTNENLPSPEDHPKSCRIIFKNGQQKDISFEDITELRTTHLSQGTIEAIAFSSVLSFLRESNHATVFVDEYLSHMHSELERYIIWLSFLMKKPDSQLFFTTHNTEVCDLRLPINSFLFLKREKDGTNTALWANSLLIKNDRNFRNYYENDYFSVLPDYSDLASIFEDAEDEDHA